MLAKFPPLTVSREDNVHNFLSNGVDAFQSESDLWYQQNKFLLFCEVLRAHFQTLFGSVTDFVIQENVNSPGSNNGARVFCVSSIPKARMSTLTL